MSKQKVLEDVNKWVDAVNNTAKDCGISTSKVYEVLKGLDKYLGFNEIEDDK